MIRRIRDYVTLVAMTNSRIEHVRVMAREVVRRAGWTARPLTSFVVVGTKGKPGHLVSYTGEFRSVTVYKKWRECFQTFIGSPRDGEIWLHFNDFKHEPKGSSHVVRWCDAIGIIAPDQAAGLRAMMGEPK